MTAKKNDFTFLADTAPVKKQSLQLLDDQQEIEEEVSRQKNLPAASEIIEQLDDRKEGEEKITAMEKVEVPKPQKWVGDDDRPKTQKTYNVYEDQHEDMQAINAYTDYNINEIVRIGIDIALAILKEEPYVQKQRKAFLRKLQED